MSKLIALRNTLLKREPKDSKFLPINSYHSVEKDKIYFVDDWRELESDSNHLLVHLSYGAGSWYIFIPHWEINLDHWEAEGEESDHGGEVSEERLDPVKFDQSNINWYDPDCRISEYFRVREVTQADSRRIPQYPPIKEEVKNMALSMDRIRREWEDHLKSLGYHGESPAIAVTSWYRPPVVNAQVGGVPNSKHLEGHAVDSYPVNRRILTYQEFLDKQVWKNKALGYGARLGFVHIDNRKGIIRWGY
jgi:putative chitinase